MSLVELEVANPVAESASVTITPAARLTDLAAKTIGLYWNFKPGGNIGLDRVAVLLAQRYPSITFRHFEGSIGAAVRHITMQQADDAAAEFDAVVGTTGD
jgi:hypothetical protein